MGILVYSLISVLSGTVPGIKFKSCLVAAVVDGFVFIAAYVVVVESALAELDHIGRLVGSLGIVVVDVVIDSFVTVLVW